MDGLDASSIFIFVASTFEASLITGLAGFAFGIIAAGPWLHVLKPAQATTLIVVFGLLVQSYSVWKLRGQVRPSLRDDATFQILLSRARRSKRCRRPEHVAVRAEF